MIKLSLRGEGITGKEILPNLYEALSRSGFFGKTGEPRQLVLRVLEEISTTKGRKIIILQAPPGYGKTAIPYAIGLSTMFDHSSYCRSIHVLPLRSIIEDVWLRLQKFLMKLGISKHLVDSVIGAQMMYVHGSPFLQKNMVFTTIDTFFMSAAKLPPQELSRVARGLYGYYEIPRASILQSAVVFDEVHLFIEESTGRLKKGKVGKAQSALMSLIRFLLHGGVPVVVMSATMPSKLREELVRMIRAMGHKIEVSELLYYRDGRDPDFESIKASSKVKNIPIIIKSSDECIKAIRRIVEEKASSYSRILVVLNTVKRAVKLYRQLNVNASLLHSLFTPPDRAMKLKELKNKDKWVLVSTQVVEAGVDISAEVLITDASPANSLVQRAGRACRRGESEGEIIVIYDEAEANEGYGIYDSTLIERTFRYIMENCSSLIWHLPKVDDSFVKSRGYEDLIESVYADFKFKLTPKWTYEMLLKTPFPDSKTALEFYLDYGSFTRDTPLMPLILLPSFVKDGDILDASEIQFLSYNNGIPAKPSILYSLAKNGLLSIIERCSGNSYRIKFLTKDDEYVKMLYRGISYLLRLILKGEIVAYATWAEAYSPELGLVKGVNI